MAPASPHDDRRRRIAALSCRLIATRGLDGLTIRTVAAEVGFSTAVVTHYFRNKRDLLLHTYEHAAARTMADDGESEAVDLDGLLGRLLPLTPLSIENWRVFVAFWGAAAGDAEFAARQREHVHAARGLVAQRLPERLAPDVREDAARRLLATVMGIATQAIFDPDEWPAERQHAAVRAVLRAVT